MPTIRESIEEVNNLICLEVLVELHVEHHEVGVFAACMCPSVYDGAKCKKRLIPGEMFMTLISEKELMNSRTF